VEFRFFRNGTTDDPTIKKSSGNPIFDRSAQNAVLAPRTFPSFPEAMTEPYHDVEMVFLDVWKPKAPEVDTSKYAQLETAIQQSVATTPSSVFNIAYNDYLRGKYQLAAAGFQQFMKDFPRAHLTPKAYYFLGECYYREKDYSQAIQAFEYVVSEFSGSDTVPTALFKLGVVAAETGDISKSQRSLKRLVQEFPTSDEAGLAKVIFAKTQ
jgi:tol-pal system protein YbgF